MFKFLKDKLKGALGKFSKEVEEEAKVEEVVEEDAQEEPVEKAPGKEQEAVPEQERSQEEAEPKESPAAAQAPPKIEEAAPEEAEPEIEEAPAEKTPLPKEPEEEQAPTAEEKESEPAPEKEEKASFLGRMFKKKQAAGEEPEQEPPAEEPAKEPEPPREEAPATQQAPAKKEGFFTRMTKVTLSKEKFEDLFWELEVTLLENNVAVKVIERIKADLKEALTGEKVARRGIEELITETLRNTIKDILSVEPLDLLRKAQEKKPLIITMIGINGSGKTTTLAKLIKYFQDHGKSVVVAAADTFRAAAIQQLEEHTTRLGVKLIKHDYNADPAAVAYDAVKHATAKGLDVVLIDSAGRLHSNDNLMNELKKLIRINKPDLNLFVGEAITGNDCVEQAKLFDEAVGIDGIILAKADVDEKGGAAISASYVTKKPVLFLGTGQNYEDLTPFRPEVVLSSLGLE